MSTIHLYFHFHFYPLYLYPQNRAKLFELSPCDTSSLLLVYKIPYRRPRAWPSARASKNILHTSLIRTWVNSLSFSISKNRACAITLHSKLENFLKGPRQLTLSIMFNRRILNTVIPNHPHLAYM